MIASLRRAVAAAPDDTTLRMHLAEQLLAAADRAGAVSCAADLQAGLRETKPSVGAWLESAATSCSAPIRTGRMPSCAVT